MKGKLEKNQILGLQAEMEKCVSDTRNTISHAKIAAKHRAKRSNYDEDTALFYIMERLEKYLEPLPAICKKLCDYTIDHNDINVKSFLEKMRFEIRKCMGYEWVKEKYGLFYTFEVCEKNIDDVTKRDTPPEPQRWESKIEGSSRALGRKRIPVKDLILLNDKDKVFTKLKENLKGKSKDAAMEILINNIKNGTLMKPSWNAFCDAFPMVEIKEGTYYYKLRKAGI